MEVPPLGVELREMWLTQQCSPPHLEVGTSGDAFTPGQLPAVVHEGQLGSPGDSAALGRWGYFGPAATARFLWHIPQNTHKERILPMEEMLEPISPSPGP